MEASVYGLILYESGTNELLVGNVRVDRSLTVLLQSFMRAAVGKLDGRLAGHGASSSRVYA